MHWSYHIQFVMHGPLSNRLLILSSSGISSSSSVTLRGLVIGWSSIFFVGSLGVVFFDDFCRDAPLGTYFHFFANLHHSQIIQLDLTTKLHMGILSNNESFLAPDEIWIHNSGLSISSKV